MGKTLEAMAPSNYSAVSLVGFAGCHRSLLLDSSFLSLAPLDAFA